MLVDDEPLVRQGLQRLIGAEADLQVVGECRNGPSAVETIRRERPDLVLLDVQMPGMDGISVLRALGSETPRAVIFVTAFDQFALDAFEHHAVDYLLKPFDDRRFQVALGRARERLQAGGSDLRLSRLLERLAAPRWADRLPVRLGSKVTLVAVETVDWIEAADNYVRLHAGPDRHLLRETLRTIEAQLDPARFARIHRSAIVNLSRVRELEALPSGDYQVLLTTGVRLTLSRTFRKGFEERLGRSLG